MSEQNDANPANPAGDSRADLALKQSLVAVAPLVRWLLRSGVHYGAFAQALKTVFLDEARHEIERSGRRVTDSALSMLSGVHRKDVRLLSDQRPGEGSFSPTPASAAFTRWLTHPDYRDGDAVRRQLPRTGEGITFETLARETSRDVHPRTLLDELERLALVSVEGDVVTLRNESFTPGAGEADAAALMAANAADHLAAAVHNLDAASLSRFLEQSVFANGLTVESARMLADVARELWRPAFEGMVAAATERVKADDDIAHTPARVRFGVYFYHDGDDAQPPQGVAAKGRSS